ncbi:MAG: M16 family metallopeptidase, partial [Fibrobacterota bacterium]
DLTAYIVTLPAHKYELFFNIESDRMENLVLREFYSERDVVTEERRQVYENNTMRHYLLKLNALFYTASPYRNPTIGWYSDIRNYTTEKLRTHISRYYRPDNAMIVIAGNIDTSKVYESAKKYFGDIEVPETEIPRVVTREPDPVGVKRFEIRDRAASRVDILFHTTGFPQRDIYKLDVVENILSGESGRLYQRLVQEEGLCSEVDAQNRWAKRDGRFHIWAQLLPHADHEEVETIILDEIKTLSAEEPAEHELTRTRNQLEKHFVFQLKDLERLSDNLAYFENFSSWQDLFRYTEEINSVEETADVVQEYLNPDFRTVGYLIDEKENRND